MHNLGSIFRSVGKRNGIKLLLLLTFNCLFIVHQTSAQSQSRIDSLKQAFLENTDSATKYDILLNIQNYYFNSQIDSSEVYIRKMLDFAKKENHVTYTLAAEMNLGNYYYYKGENKKAIAQYRKVLALYKKYDSPLDTGMVMLNLSYLEAGNGNYQKALQLTDSVIDMTRDVGYGDTYYQALKIKGRHLSSLGHYSKALEYFTKVKQIYDSINEGDHPGHEILGDIGSTQLKLKNYPQAIKTYTSLMEIDQKENDKVNVITCLSRIGDGYRGMNDHDQALSNYGQALDLAQQAGVPTLIPRLNASLGRVYMVKGELPNAIRYLKNSIAHDSLISKREWTEYTSYLGKAYMQQGNYNVALNHLNRAVSTADTLGTPKELADALLIRSEVFEKRGQLENAIGDLKNHQTINDSILTFERSKQINELQIIYETEMKESEIALQQEEIKTLNEKVKVDKLTKRLFAGGMFTFVAVSGLVFFGYRQRMKKNRIAREKQEEIYKQEIAHKKKELASQTLHLVQKNTFIRELKENLEHLKGSPDTFKTEFRRIVMLLKKENASDKDWEIFKTYFAEVHNDFDQKLKTLYEGISEKEIRLAAFLRMNLTTKEIAATMNILPESILTSKYRLKKKLGLDKRTDLTGFLNSL